MEMQPDEFIDQINRKQMPAFRELFGTFYRYLVLYALRYVKQQEVSEDVVQEVLRWMALQELMVRSAAM